MRSPRQQFGKPMYELRGVWMEYRDRRDWILDGQALIPSCTTLMHIYDTATSVKVSHVKNCAGCYFCVTLDSAALLGRV